MRNHQKFSVMAPASTNSQLGRQLSKFKPIRSMASLYLDRWIKRLSKVSYRYKLPTDFANKHGMKHHIGWIAHLYNIS